MVAGEASGDQLGSHLIAALKARRPQLAFFGIGGPRMGAEGFEASEPMDKLAVRGYSEALRHYREITRIRQRGDRSDHDKSPHAITIDPPARDASGL